MPGSVFEAHLKLMHCENQFNKAKNPVKKTWFLLRSIPLGKKFDREIMSFVRNDKEFGGFYKKMMELDVAAWDTARTTTDYWKKATGNDLDPARFYKQPTEVANFGKEFIQAAIEWENKEYTRIMSLIEAGKYKQKFTEILGNFSIVKHGLPLLVSAILGAAVSYLTYAAFQSPLAAIGIVVGAIACGVAMVFDGMKQGY